MIAVVVTLRGLSTESDPEPKFSRRRQPSRLICSRVAASVEGAFAASCCPSRRTNGMRDPDDRSVT
jgi:hypothetical protein